jgi:hypothetical protein
MRANPAAERMRLSRARRRHGIRVVPFEVRDAEIEALINHKLLAPSHSSDRQAIASALGKLLDIIPLIWWQIAIDRKGSQ